MLLSLIACKGSRLRSMECSGRCSGELAEPVRISEFVEGCKWIQIGTMSRFAIARDPCMVEERDGKKEAKANGALRKSFAKRRRRLEYTGGTHFRGIIVVRSEGKWAICSFKPIFVMLFPIVTHAYPITSYQPFTPGNMQLFIP